MPDAPAKRGLSASAAVAAGILSSRIAGLIRERVFAHYLGNTDAAGAFKAALRIPNILQNLFGEGVLSASFIPVYARLRGQGRDEDASRVASAVANLLLLTVAVLVAAGVTGSRWLTLAIAPGFKGEVRDLTEHLVAIMFAGTGILVLSAWCLGVLNSHRKFFLSYVAPVLWNVAQIAALIYFGASMASGEFGRMQLVEKVAWATVVGSALQLGVQLPQALKLCGGLRATLSLTFEPVRTVLRNFVPVVIGRGVVQLSAYVDQILSSWLGAAAVSGMAYAQQLYLLPISLFGMSVSAAELPEMSRDASSDALRTRLEAGVLRISFYVVPSAIAFLALGDVVTAMLYQTGKFGREDTMFVWMILAGSTVGLLAATQARLCSSAFYALHDTRTPLYYAIVRVTITGALGWVFAFPVRKALGLGPAYGAAALTATAGVAGWVEFLLLRHGLTARIGHFRLGGRITALCWIAAVIAGGAAFGLHRVLPVRRPLVSGVVVLGVFGVLYLAFALLLRIPEARALTSRFRPSSRRP
jgi:putative peptidoglycan lipid II flippase